MRRATMGGDDDGEIRDGGRVRGWAWAGWRWGVGKRAGGMPTPTAPAWAAVPSTSTMINDGSPGLVKQGKDKEAP